MTRQEAQEQFQKEAQPILEQGKTQFYQNFSEKVEELAEILQKVITDIRGKVEEFEKEKIMFFHFSLMRVGILQENYEVLAQAMDARWYMDTEPAEVWFSLDCLFSMFLEVRKTLKEEARKYMGKINSYDIEYLIEEVVMECNSFIAQQLRFMFRDIEENNDFMAIEKTDVWGIYWGEYRDNYELVVHVDREPKTQLDFDRALRQTKNVESNMISGFWYETQIKDSDCKDKLLYFIQFENCQLENICFDGAILSGAQFKNCTIKNCSFQNAKIRQAIFENCSWENNNFMGADMAETVVSEKGIPFMHLEPEQLQTIYIDRG